MVSVPLTEGNNQNFVRGSPTTLSFFVALGLLRKSNKGDATEDNNWNFARGCPNDIFIIFNFFGWHSISFTN